MTGITLFWQLLATSVNNLGRDSNLQAYSWSPRHAAWPMELQQRLTDLGLTWRFVTFHELKMACIRSCQISVTLHYLSYSAYLHSHLHSDRHARARHVTSQMSRIWMCSGTNCHVVCLWIAFLHLSLVCNVVVWAWKSSACKVTKHKVPPAGDLLYISVSVSELLKKTDLVK